MKLQSSRQSFADENTAENILEATEYKLHFPTHEYSTNSMHFGWGFCYISEKNLASSTKFIPSPDEQGLLTVMRKPYYKGKEIPGLSVVNLGWRLSCASTSCPTQGRSFVFGSVLIFPFVSWGCNAWRIGQLCRSLNDVCLSPRNRWEHYFHKKKPPQFKIGEEKIKRQDWL